jgi:hypothetical protein
VLVLLGVLCAVIAVSVFGAPDPFEDDALALISTYGVGMGVLVVVLATAGLNAGSRWAWAALWVLPVFFVAHVGLLGTWLPDGVLLVVSCGALLLARPRGERVVVPRAEATSAA